MVRHWRPERQLPTATGPICWNRARTVPLPCPSPLVPTPRPLSIGGFGVKHIAREEQRVGGQLGRPSGARFRTYTRLKAYADSIKGQLFDIPALHQVLDDIYRYPLRQAAVDTLNRQLRSGVDDAVLAELVIALRDEYRLCLTEDQETESQEPRIICSLGLFDTQEGD